MNMCKHNFLALSLFVCGAAWAENSPTAARIVGDPDALMGPKSTARGSSTTASHLVHDSIFQNPAAAVIDKTYIVTLGYTPVGDQLSASIVDTRSSNIGGGLAYVRRDLRDIQSSPLALGNYRRTEDRAALSFFGMASDELALGVLGKYTYQKSYDGLSENGKNWNGDIGAKYFFSNSFQIGLAAQNLLKDDKGMNLRAFSAGIETLPLRSVNVSARVIHFPKLPASSEFRYSNTEKTTGFSVGAEWAAYRGLSLRAGYKEQPAWNEKLASAGAGYTDKEWGVDYAFQISTLGDKSNSHMATLFGKF